MAIVTGANSGLGKAIVVGLLENGMKVVGIARREDLLAVRIIINDNLSILSTRNRELFSVCR